MLTELIDLICIHCFCLESAQSTQAWDYQCLHKNSIFFLIFVINDVCMGQITKQPVAPFTNMD